MMRLLFFAVLCLNALVAAREPDCESFYPLRVGDTAVYKRISWFIPNVDISFQTSTIDSSFQQGDKDYYLRKVIILDTLGDTVWRSYDTLFLSNSIIYLANGRDGPCIDGFASIEGYQNSISIRQQCQASTDTAGAYDTILCQSVVFKDFPWVVPTAFYEKFTTPLWLTIQASPYNFDSCFIISGADMPYESYYYYFVRGVGMIYSFHREEHWGYSTELIYSNSPCLQNALGTKRKSIKPLRRKSFSNPEMFDLMGRRIKGISSVSARNEIVIMRSNGVTTTQIRMGLSNNRRDANFR